jgi:MIP family channel proteins
MSQTDMKAFIAEFSGVFALCFVGILAISAPGLTGQPPTDLLGVALAHGLILAVMIAAMAAVSGAHFNPAVTVGLLAIGAVSPATALRYIAAQLLGGTVAGLLLVGLFGREFVQQGTPVLGAAIPFTTGLILEVVATFFLALVVVCGVLEKRAPQPLLPMMIGLVVAADILAIGPLTGAAMNPARVFGPALASGQWNSHGLYWIGPLIGGVLAALTGRWVVNSSEQETRPA